MKNKSNFQLFYANICVCTCVSLKTVVLKLDERTAKKKRKKIGTKRNKNNKPEKLQDIKLIKL